MTDDISRYQIRGPNPTIDPSALAALGRDTFVATFGHIYAKNDLDRFLAEKHSAVLYQQLLDDPQTGVWVCLDERDEALGYLVAGPCGLPVEAMPDRSGELMRFYLRPECQGRGIGKLMLEKGLAWLEAQFDHVYLSVFSENLGAQRLYGRYGFRKIQEYDYMVGDHADHEFIFKRVE